MKNFTSFEKDMTWDALKRCTFILLTWAAAIVLIGVLLWILG